MNQIQFDWTIVNKQMDMLFVGGLIGVSSGADKALQPVFGYSIMDNKIVEGEWREV